ncbi:hypothetical protein [Fulvimarina endophytica]|nr:hypothetical protein [Fulvimarina endophytica]
MMKKLAILSFAILTLSGFTLEEAIQRFEGGWQAEDQIYGNKGAIEIDSENKRIVAAAFNSVLRGDLDEAEVVGGSLVISTPDGDILLYGGNESNEISARIGNTPTMRFVRVPPK